MLQPDLKSYVIEKVKPDEYYRSRFSNYNPRTKINVTCCFHPHDSKPSLSINLRGGGARCFAASCGKSIGNIVHFEAEKLRIPEEEAARRLYDEFIRPIVPASLLEEYKQGIISNEKIRGTLTRATGLALATIAKFEIGWDQHTRRYTFPIRNQFGDVINVRLYRTKDERRPSDIKIYSLVEDKGKPSERRYGQMELFPWNDFQTYTPNQPLFFMASEKETMLARQEGLQAVCTTGGEGSWNGEWLEYFSEYDIRIIFDQDQGGIKASEKIVATLQQCARSCFSITLPFPPDYHRPDRDFDDWIKSKNGSGFQLLRLAENPNGSRPVSFSPETRERNEKEPALPRWYDKQLHEITEIKNNPDLLNHCIKTRGIVAATASKSYAPPWKFKVKTRHGIKTIALPLGRELISLINDGDAGIPSVLNKYIETPILKWEMKEHISISEVEIVPVVDVGTEQEGRYTVLRCFFTGGSIDSNTPYELTIIPVVLPQHHETVGIIVSAVEISRAIDTWVFNNRELTELETFQPREGQSVGAKLESLANEIAINHSKIYNRTDLHIVSLLTWLCPYGFYFPPNQGSLQRGWLNSLAIGDTQTGKSAVVATLQRLFKLGDIVNAENCTFVGLVGGAIKTGSGQMMIRWGRLPLCDRKLVVIEELSGLSVREIANMSEVRSIGIARLDKGGLASRTHARTRLLALSNVRQPNKTLAEYLSGVKAIRELVGHAEDISRFDLIITLIDSEVSSDVINQPEDEPITATFTPSQLQRLCQFIWALKPEQIRITDDAYLHCLEWTQSLQGIYHPSFPIFKAASGRLLIARIGVAIASAQFSWDGESIRVGKEHIIAAVELIRNLYDKPSFGYLEYSRQMYDRELIRDTPELRKTIARCVRADVIIDMFDSLIHAVRFNRDELASYGSLQLFQADDLLGALLRARVIKKGEGPTWEVTKSGKDWILKAIKEYGRESKLQVVRTQ